MNRNQMPKSWCYLTLEKGFNCFSGKAYFKHRMLPLVCLVYGQAFYKDVNVSLQVASAFRSFILFSVVEFEPQFICT